MAAGRGDLRRAAARWHADVAVAADHQDGAGIPGDRQQAGVLEEDDALLGDVLGDAGMGFGVDGRGRRGVEQAGDEHRAKDAAGHVGHALGGNGAGGDGVAQRLVEPDFVVQLLARLPVESGGGGFDAGGRAPIGHHEAGIAPVALEHAGEQRGILTGIAAVDLVVGGHDRAGRAAIDRDLEGEQVAFAQRRHVDGGIDDVAAGLLVVEDEMLGGGDDAVGLDAADRFAAEDAGEQRILAQILEIAAAARIARQVDAAAEQHVEPLGRRLRADRGAAGISEIGVPGGGEGEAGGECGGGVAGAAVAGIGDAEAGVCLVEAGDAEAGDRRDEAGAGHRALGRGHAGQHARGPAAVEQAVPLVLGQFGFEQRRACIGRERGVQPRGGRGGILGHGRLLPAILGTAGRSAKGIRSGSRRSGASSASRTCCRCGACRCRWCWAPARTGCSPAPSRGRR